MRFVCIGLVAMCLAGAAITGEDAKKAGLNASRLALIPQRMKELVDEGIAAGCVTLVSRHGVIAEISATGYQNLEEKKPMRTDSIFQIMSMTKPFTAVGVMMLVEDGRLALNEPVEKYLPEFRGQMVIAGKNADGSVLLKKPARPMIVRDLMTHTSGLNGNPPASIKELPQKLDLTLAQAVSIYAQAPLDYEPGSKWQYANTGIATLGRLIEVASGMPYEKFIAQRIWEPLGMKDSFFFPPADKIGRIALVYKREGNKLVPAGGGILGGDPRDYRKGAKYPAPEWGMFSTAEDLIRFYQMMLNGGTYQGKRYLSKMTVDLMRQVHTNYIPNAGWLSPEHASYGLAWEVVHDPLVQVMLLAPGTYGHGGAFGTQGWIDPSNDLIRVFMIASASNSNDFRSAFFQIAGSAVE